MLISGLSKTISKNMKAFFTNHLNRRGRIIGEFSLIVIGVLVALTVETALDERQNEQLRDEYYSRVHADLIADKTAIESRIIFFRVVEQFNQDTLDWLESDVAVSQDVLLAAFYAAEVWPFVPNLSTYQDLQSTGNIRLMDNIDFRTSLAAYYNKAGTSAGGFNPSEDYRQIVRGVIPSRIQAQIRVNCPTTDDRDQKPTGFPPCALADVDYGQLTALFLPLKSDSQFRQTLTYRTSELGVMIYLLSQQLLFADEVLQHIPSP
jgi:hypothetical protein